jgi:uncharacterized protein DUF4288
MWFGASLLYRSSEPLDEQGTQLYEERLIILEAIDEGEAWKKAHKRGLLLEEEYTNAEGRRVTWTFERAVEIKEIIEDQLGDGVEVFSRFLCEDEVRNLTSSISKT